MATALLHDTAPVVDMGDCHDIFVSGIARLERLPGNCLRFVCYVEEEDGGHPRRTIVLKCIWPIELLPAAIAQVTEAVAKAGLSVLETGASPPLN